MIWLELLPFVVIVGVAFLESKRGFGYALFDFAGGIIAIKLALYFAPSMSTTLPTNYTPEAAKALWFGLLFVIFGCLALLASKLLYQNTLLSLDFMDPVVGGIIGILSGILLAHAILLVIVGMSTGELHKEVMRSGAVKQFVKFEGFNNLIKTMSSVGDLPKSED